jgi:hypothetical protein
MSGDKWNTVYLICLCKLHIRRSVRHIQLIIQCNTYVSQNKQHVFICLPHHNLCIVSFVSKHSHGNKYKQQYNNCHFYATVGKHPPLRKWQYRVNCLLCGPRQSDARNNRASIARQRSCEHVSLKKDGVFLGVRTEELSWRQSALRVTQFSVEHSHGSS